MLCVMLREDIVCCARGTQHGVSSKTSHLDIVSDRNFPAQVHEALHEIDFLWPLYLALY